MPTRGATGILFGQIVVVLSVALCGVWAGTDGGQGRKHRMPGGRQRREGQGAQVQRPPTAGFVLGLRRGQQDDHRASLGFAAN